MSVGTDSKPGARRRNPVLSDEEVESARQHAEERDWGSSPKKPGDAPGSIPVSKNTRKEKKGWLPQPVRVVLSAMVVILAVGTMIAIVVIITVIVQNNNAREERLDTAQRELQGYADVLNRSLPVENHVVINEVKYLGEASDEMLVRLTQGNTTCTAPVNPPDDKHNLYWAEPVKEIAVGEISSTTFKCVQTISFAGLGAS